jgi:hypothetical protein
VKTLKLLKRDTIFGIFRRWYMYVLPIILAFIQCVQCHESIVDEINDGKIHTNGTFMDYLLFGMQGMNVYKFSPKEFFDIPIYWFAFQIGIAYFVAYYAYNDFVQNGRALFIATKERKSWWNGKFVWCICSTVIYFAVYFVCMEIFSKMFGATNSMKMTYAYGVNRLAGGLMYVSNRDIIFMTMVVPVVVTASVCIFQMLLGFIVSPVVSFALSCAIYVVSAFYTAWPFIGNYTMWLRSSYVDDEGVSPVAGLTMAIGIAIISYISGRIYFDSKDVL